MEGRWRGLPHAEAPPEESPSSTGQAMEAQPLAVMIRADTREPALFAGRDGTLAIDDSQSSARYLWTRCRIRGRLVVAYSSTRRPSWQGRHRTWEPVAYMWMLKVPDLQLEDRALRWGPPGRGSDGGAGAIGAGEWCDSQPTPCQRDALGRSTAPPSVTAVGIGIRALKLSMGPSDHGGTETPKVAA